MAFWNNWIKPKSEKRQFGFVDDWYSVDTNSIQATPNSCLGIPAVFSAVNIVSSNVAKLDLNVWKVNSSGNKTLDQKHNIQKLLKLRPNVYMSSFDFKRTMVANYLLWGNAYVWLSNFDTKGNVTELMLLNPNATTVEHEVTGGSIYYRSTHPMTNKPLVLQPYQVIHLKHFSTDGLVGKSPIRLVADSLGQKLGMIKHSKKLYENGTTTNFALKTQEFLSPEAKSNLRGAWQRANSGVENLGKVAVLDGGIDLQNISMPMKDAQFIETMQFSIREIASIFNVPPHMLADNSGLKYSNISHQAMSFLQECLQPILTMIQQEFLYKLMLPNEQTRYELIFDTSEMIKATDIERGQFYEMMVRNNIMTIDECRLLEGYNPLPEDEKIPAAGNPIDNSEESVKEVNTEDESGDSEQSSDN
jgi:HK97 family phage portal protein